jgi:hypothetical protein
MKSTYEIVSELKFAKDAIIDMMEQTEGEITDAVSEVLEKIQQLQVESSQKIAAVDWVFGQIQERKAMIEGAAKYHADRLAQYKANLASIEVQQDRLKYKVMDLMLANNMDAIDLEHKKIKLMYSKSLVVEELDKAIANVPQEYLRTKVEIDKTPLKKHIEETGVSYDGVVIQESPYIRGL